MKENYCELCGEKLKNKEDSALFYCVKCGEQKNEK